MELQEFLNSAYQLYDSEVGGYSYVDLTMKLNYETSAACWKSYLSSNEGYRQCIYKHSTCRLCGNHPETVEHLISGYGQ